MTESEWLACDDPDILLKKSRFRNYRRKSRLFAVACCRCVWTHLPDGRSLHAIEVAERHADALATDEELTTAGSEARQAHREMFAVLGKVGSTLEWAAEYVADANPLHAAKTVTWMVRWPRLYEHPREFGEAPRLSPCTVERRTSLPAALLGKWKMALIPDPISTGADKATECRLIRDIFGNPFCPVTVEPAWLTSDVVALAWKMYESRDFSPMPILADALQDGGCENEAILNHCRSEGVHVRGCHVVDLLLGKS